MRKILILGAALASLTASAGAAMAAVQPIRSEMIVRVDDAWRDCRSWDRHHHMCRDHDWDRTRWNEREWYGHRVCGTDHDHYLDAAGHWRRCA